MENTGNPYKIMIVEDEAIIAKDISSRLTKLGYLVTGTAQSCDGALELIENEIPDIILMDIVIKGAYDGIDSAKMINEKYSIPIVYLTAHSDQYTIERTKFTNPYGFISKPVDDRELEINIENALYRCDAEKKLKDFQEKYYRLAENSKDIIFRYSYSEKRFEFINNACTAITGFSPHEFYDNRLLFSIFIIPAEVDFSIEGPVNVDNEYSIIDKNNNIKWIKLSAIILKDTRNVTYAIEGIAYDITDKIKYEQKLKNTNDKLHALAEHLESIREKERLGISRELHDQFGQDMTGLKLTASLLLKKINNHNSEIDRNYFENELNIVIKKIDEIFSNIRRITADLRPDLLDRLGLIEAVNWQVENFESKTGIKCTLNISGSDSGIDEKTSLSLYRIMQELLTNLFRHSKASNAMVTFKFTGNSVELIVSDNGIGFDTHKLDDSKSLGIIGLQERIYSLGGEIEYNSLPGTGTECRVVIPVNTSKISI
ncbi:MAG TPA: response regulator [Ignavibacteria bacterium]|nr:response regulator [Ignavibacteria bacterium]